MAAQKDAKEVPPRIYAQIDYEDPYVQPLLLQALRSRLPSQSYELTTTLPSDPNVRLLQILQYESLAFERALQNPDRVLVNAYVIRKALIRKHFLAATVANWIKKKPDSILARNVKPAYDFELDYAEFLDEALTEAYEMRDSLNRNADLSPDKREWWILKPSMSDRGQGIRIFSIEEELSTIFEEWEEAEEDSDEEELESKLDDKDGSWQAVDSGHIITSQLRHFVAQPYIHPPLLLADYTERKFHIRTYVIAVGALKVYLYKPMLALFAASDYAPPWIDSDLKAHLSNTCLQGTNIREDSVRAFWDLEDSVPSLSNNWKENVFDQICSVTGELFEAAARNMMVHFQTLPFSFELFGLDFLVDEDGKAWFLEVNAFPDFKQTGDLKELVQGLFEEVMDIAVKPFFSIESNPVTIPNGRTVKVLDIDLGRK
jgi:tubulin---tyrosine ligase